jgi:Dirigent-like protein
MRRRLPAALAAIAAAVTMAVPAATAATQARSSVFYAKPTRAQFINQSDSRALGNLTNPFNADALPTPRNANSGKKGARAGDTARFTLTLYSDRTLRRPVGTASYSCTFNFGQEATCDAHFEFGNGSMVAMGPARLDGSQIVLPVIGGTGRYRGAHGQVTSTATGKKNTQIVRFLLV